MAHVMWTERIPSMDAFEWTNCLPIWTPGEHGMFRMFSYKDIREMHTHVIENMVGLEPIPKTYNMEDVKRVLERRVSRGNSRALQVLLDIKKKEQVNIP